MIDLILDEQIVSFVKTGRLVRESQIFRFFRDWDEDFVKYTMSRLMHNQKLYRHKEEYISTAQYLPGAFQGYESMIDAYEALCEFKSEEILWIAALSFPMDLCFGTVSGKVYNVETFDANWQIKRALTPSARAANILTGEEDTVTHIAVVHDVNLIDKICSLSFHHYIVINPNGTNDLYDAE